MTDRDKTSQLIFDYHNAARILSYYNAAEGESYREEAESRGKARESYRKALQALHDNGIEVPTENLYLV